MKNDTTQSKLSSVIPCAGGVVVLGIIYATSNAVRELVYLQYLLVMLIAMLGFNVVLILTNTIRALDNEVKELKEKLKSSHAP